jgi:hypothetical protein
MEEWVNIKDIHTLKDKGFLETFYYLLLTMSMEKTLLNGVDR